MEAFLIEEDVAELLDSISDELGVDLHLKSPLRVRIVLLNNSDIIPNHHRTIDIHFGSLGQIECPYQVFSLGNRQQ